MSLNEGGFSMFKSRILNDWKDSPFKSVLKRLGSLALKKNGCPVCYAAYKAMQNGQKPEAVLPELIEALVESKNAAIEQAKIGYQMRPIVIPKL